MASERKVSNPLALAVMALLFERPMHAYEMVSLMRERAKHESVRLRYSSLYSVVAALEREGLISAHETSREGRRPERTVYEITATGRGEFRSWLRELLSEPKKEYPQFMAGLSFILGVHPDEAVALLEERVRRLEAEVEDARVYLEDNVERLSLPRLFVIEHEHELVLKEAELRWVRDLVRRIKDGTLDGVSGWRSFYAQNAAADEKKSDGRGGGQMT